MDTPSAFQENFPLNSNFTKIFKESAFEALKTEAILVIIWQIYHSV